MIWRHVQFFIPQISGYDDQLLQQQRRPQHVQPYQHHVTSAAGTMPRRSPPSLSPADSAPPPRRSSTLVRRGGAHAQSAPPPNQFPEVTSTTTHPQQQQQRSVRFEEAGTESRRNEVGWVNIVLYLRIGRNDTPFLQHSPNLSPALKPSPACPHPLPFQPCLKTRVMRHITYSLSPFGMSSLRSLAASRGTCKCWRTLSSWPRIRLRPRRRQCRSSRRPHSATPPRPLRHRRRSEAATACAIIIINNSNSCSSSAFRRRSGVAGIWTTR